MATLTATLRAPAQISSQRRSDQHARTERHIPGWTLRGAIAAAWLRWNGPLNDQTRDQFIRLFEGGVRFGPLYAGSPPPSRALVEHKYGGTDCPASPVDLALRPDLDTPKKCDSCHEALKTVEWGHQDRPAVHRRTSVAITDSGVADPGKLFSRDRVLPSDPASQPVSFRGLITGEDGELLEELTRVGGIRIGARRSTHGRVDLTLTAETSHPTIECRDDGILVLRLVSPAVFVDDTGRPSLLPSVSELEDQLGVAVHRITPWARWGFIGGWHMASGLPKPTETTVESGSTYAVTLSDSPSAEALAALGRAGLGLRRHEGFGHLGDSFARIRPTSAREAASA